MPKVNMRKFDRPSLGHVFAVVVVLAAFLIRQLLVLNLHLNLPPFIFFYPAVMIVAVLYGIWPGLLATLLATLFTEYWVISPVGHFFVQDASGVITLLVFFMMSVIMSMLAERYRRHERRLGALNRAQELYETRSRLAAALASMTDAVFISDAEGRFLDFNDAFATFHKYKCKADCAQTFAEYPAILDVLTAEGKPIPLEMWAVPRALRGETASNVEYTVRRKDTGETWIGSYSFSPILDPEGAIVGSVVTARDITERKQAEHALQASETRYRTAFQTSPDCVNINRLEDGVYVNANNGFGKITGYKPEEVLGKTPMDINLWVIPDDRKRFVEALRQNSECRNFETRFRAKDGHIFWGLVSSSVVELDGVRCHLSITRDITAHKQAELALRASETRYRTTFNTSIDCVNINRLEDGAYVDVNDGFCKITGYTPQEVLGKTPLEIEIWADPKDRKPFVEALQKNSECRNFETRFRAQNGTLFWGMISASLMELDGVACYLSITRDITAAKLAEERIRNLVNFDPLTGLANRRQLMERLQRNMDGRTRPRVKRALLIVDLDNFKALNDTLGHQTGDLVLCEIAQRISACAREGDTVARLGGDEFVVLLESLSEVPEDAAAQADAIADTILTKASLPCSLDDHEYSGACSIGITVFDDDQENMNEVLQQADIAMYQAKTAGRNTTRFFAPALQAAVNIRAAMEEDLRQGIKASQFQLFYQPQVECGRVIGAEALLRWNHPRQGILYPGAFIALAEETRLILPLGDWVLESACRQIAAWSKRPQTAALTVSVNISALQLRKPDFAEHVLAIVEQNGANPHSLELEITETVLVENVEEAIVKMTALKTHGVRFSMDDFGTGYSSLDYLKRLPLDQLKIDQSFIRDLFKDASSGVIAQAIVNLGKAMNMSIIAEGVETEEQRAFLAHLGCDSYQGYLFSRPVPLEDFERLLPSVAGNAVPILH